jgi:hypothetical protein
MVGYDLVTDDPMLQQSMKPRRSMSSRPKIPQPMAVVPANQKFRRIKDFCSTTPESSSLCAGGPHQPANPNIYLQGRVS